MRIAVHVFPFMCLVCRDTEVSHYSQCIVMRADLAKAEKKEKARQKLLNDNVAHATVPAYTATVLVQPLRSSGRCSFILTLLAFGL